MKSTPLPAWAAIRWLGVSVALPAMLAGCVSAPPAQIDASAPAKWRAPLQAASLGASAAKPALSAPQAASASAAAASTSNADSTNTNTSTDPNLPHGGSVPQLLDWWRAWNDPLLPDLIESAQTHSPTLASAAARIAQARFGATASTSAMLPNVGVAANVTRAPTSQQPFAGTIVHTHSLGAQLQWEIDLFGGLNHARRAANARLDAAQAMWHEARVSLAADVAGQYFALRSCQRGLEILQADAASQEETARLTGQLSQAGFAAPSNYALAQAGAAQAQAQRTQLEVQCTAAIKGLSALTSMDEDVLRTRLATPVTSQPPALAVDAVPGQALAQRPDVFAAAQALAAASGDVGYARAQQFPHLAIGGSISRLFMTSHQPRLDEIYKTVWSVGPLGISLPILDWGRISANLHSSKAQYEASVMQYQMVLRNAVRDVETALVNLHSAQQRTANTNIAVEGFDKAFAAANAKYKAGMGSMLELENARRNLNNARLGQSALQQQTESAWVALYRALGGGWTQQTNPTQADHDLIATGQAARTARATSAAMPAQAATPQAPASAPETAHNKTP